MASRPERVVWHELTCPICDKRIRLTGQERNRRKLQTCGDPSCIAALRRRRTPPADKTARLKAASDKRALAHAASPLTGTYATNANARQWHLRAPDGAEYSFANLALWLRQHAGLFDPDDVRERPQSRSGTTTRAQSRLGSLRPERASRKRSWKGWRWVEQGKEMP